jgi:hypothetical protein
MFLLFYMIKNVYNSLYTTVIQGEIEMNKRLIIMLMLSALLSSKSQAKTWDTYTPVSRPYVSSPVSNGTYLCGSKVTFQCTRGSDKDRWTDFCDEGTSSDSMSSNYPRWSANYGSFEDGDYIGGTVYWIAPNTERSSISVVVWDNDLPKSIPPGDSGTRNDSSVSSSRVIRTIIPYVYSLDYGGGNHRISDVTLPEYCAYPVQNEPASWSFGANATVTARFWHCYYSLSQEETGVIVRAETSGDGFNIGDWGDSDPTVFTTAWPYPPLGAECESEATIDSSIQIQDYNSTWKYRCEYGSDTWITMQTIGNCRLYVVYGPPSCESSNYTKDHLEWACSAASGADTPREIADEIQSALAGDPPIDGSGGTQTDDWELLDGSPYRGECDEQARFMIRILNLLGVSG